MAGRIIQQAIPIITITQPIHSMMHLLGVSYERLSAAALFPDFFSKAKVDTVMQIAAIKSRIPISPEIDNSP
jgi:hypothetical protein